MHKGEARIDQEILKDARRAKDRAAATGDKAEYNRLRDLVDSLVHRMQSKGSLGTLDLETLAGNEEDQ